MKLLVVVMLTLCLTMLPAAAQTDFDGAAWLPAETAGMLTLMMTSPTDAAQTLNLLTFFATLIQPERIGISEAQPLSSYFPTEYFDTEGDPFAAIAPWIVGDMVIGYLTLADDYTLRPEDMVMILPTRDAFAAAAGLSAVLTEQDFLQSGDANGIPVYTGDRATFAFAPEAVVVGSAEAVEAVLTVRRGEAAALSADDRLIAIRRQTAEQLPDAPLFLFAQGEAAANIVPVLLGATPEAADLLPALAETAVAFTGSATPETALLAGEADAVGVRLRPDTLLGRDARAAAVIHLPEALAPANAPASADLLAYVPRNAFIVVQGADARLAASGALSALPLANYAPLILGGFPVGETAGSAGGVPLPSAAGLQSAAFGFAQALQAAADVDVNSIIDQFDGAFVAALLARPNDPTPILNTAADVLFAAAAADPNAAVTQIVTALEAILGAGTFETTDDGGVTAASLVVESEPVLRLAAADGVVLAGTGTAVDRALAAWAGDNQLISQPRWDQMTGSFGLEQTPNIYVDLAAFYSVYIPEEQSGGPLPFGLIGAAAYPLETGYYRLDFAFLLEAIGR